MHLTFPIFSLKLLSLYESYRPKSFACQLMSDSLLSIDSFHALYPSLGVVPDVTVPFSPDIGGDAIFLLL